MRKVWALVLFLPLFLAAGGVHAAGEGAAAVSSGKKVAVEYTLTVDGQVIDSSKERGPITYTHGQGNLLPGLVKGLEGLRVGDAKTITLTPEEAYGPIDPSAVREVEKTSLPPTITPQEGMFLKTTDPEGREYVVRIVEVKKDSVMIDFNHPLAGKTLNFQVKVLSVQ